MRTLFSCLSLALTRIVKSVSGPPIDGRTAGDFNMNDFNNDDFNV